MQHLYFLAIWTVLGVGFAAFTVRRGSLSVGGALAAMLLGGAVLYTRGGWWLLPLFVFFLSSTLIGKLLPVSSVASDAKDKQTRDAVQVLCNGAVYGAVAVAGGPPLLLLSALAVATSDTWASEIGRYFRNPTYDIIGTERIPPGVSGGISFSGTIGGIAGAAVIALLGFWLVRGFVFDDYLLVTTFGTIGMLVDSVLGSVLQARYRSAEGQLRDTPGAGSRRVSGYTWMTNDLVNFLSITLTTAATWLWLGYR